MKAEKRKAILLEVTAIGAIALFLTLVLTGTAAASPGATYYVNATGGNDANTPLQAQSPATPWKTISHAVATVPAGASAADPNIINVSAGLYDNTTNGETFPITFNNASIKLSGAGAATTIIEGEGAAEILHINPRNITIEDFTITNGTDGIYSDDFGGFTVLDNNFTNLGTGVHFDMRKGWGDLATDNYTVDDIRIRNNTFNISDYGVQLNLHLDYNATKTGYTVTIGNIDIRDNVFDMGTTTGVYIEHISVMDLTDGSIAVGEVNISGNEFYGGTKGIEFDGSFSGLTNTTVTVGDVVMNDNIFENQTDKAMDIDYYGATYWYGTTTGSYGDLEINGNTITSVTTYAIYIDAYAYFEDFYDDASLTVGNLYIKSNEINVSGDGIYVYYLAELLYNNALIAMGDAFINSNTIVSRNENGIELYYYDFDADTHGNANITTGEVHIGGTGVGEDNIIDAGSEAIYVHYGYVASWNVTDNAKLRMGDMYVENNDIEGDSHGLYINYEDEYVGHDMHNNTFAELPDYIITGNTFNVTFNGICLETNSIPYGIYEDAIFDFGGFFIDDNTFNEADVGMDSGIYLEYFHFCNYEHYDRSASIIGDVTITNNRLYDTSDDAIYVRYRDFGDELEDESTLDVGDLLIADNTLVDGDDDGIYVSYSYLTSWSESNLTMGMLDILRNNISNMGWDGITVRYDLDAGENSTQTLGRALIQGNNLTGASHYGIYLFMDKTDCEETATVTLGDPIIESNIIENWATGIYFEDVENATIKRNMIVNNSGGATGAHLNENSIYNRIFDNCFINNTPYQAVDNGENNIFDRNFWDDWSSGLGPYTINGTANNSDNHPQDECLFGQEPPAPAQLPALTPAGLITLVVVLSAIVARNIVRRRTREE